MGSATLLHAGLNDALVLAGGAHQGRTFERLGCHRFFDVHVLAGTAGVGGDLRVRIIPSGYDDSVDVVAVEQAAIIGILLDSGSREPGCFVAPDVPCVAYRDPLDIRALVGLNVAKAEISAK